MTLDPNNKNVYTLETETTEANQNFKIFPASAINGKDIDWAQALGAQKDGDTAAENFLTWKVGDKEAGAIMVEEAGKIQDYNQYDRFPLFSKRQQCSHRTLYDRKRI